MTKKAKIIKGIKVAICTLLAVALVIAGVLFFPLTGEKHVEIWSADQQFDISKIEAVEKNREDFKILMFTDTQLWADLTKNKECYDHFFHDSIRFGSRQYLLLFYAFCCRFACADFDLGCKRIFSVYV